MRVNNSSSWIVQLLLPIFLMSKKGLNREAKRNNEKKRTDKSSYDQHYMMRIKKKKN